jgi:hypothetical protein
LDEPLINSNDRSILESLDVLLELDGVRAAIDPIVERVERNLAQDEGAVMAWEPIPLAIYGESVPPSIRSSWVFILRKGATTGAERHPNSIQRMMSYRGRGDIQTGGPGRWLSHPLVAEPNADFDRRWHSIPINVWHQCVVPTVANWVVVSFHTVPAEDLIEERPDADDVGHTRQKRYLSGAE